MELQKTIEQLADRFNISVKEAWQLRGYGGVKLIDLQKKPEELAIAIARLMGDKTDMPDLSFKERFFVPGRRKDAIQELAQHLIHKFHVKTIRGKIPDLMIYQDGLYQLGNSILRQHLEKLLQEQSTAQIKNEVVKKIEDDTAILRENFQVDRRYFNLHTGIYDLETSSFFPHDPKFLFLHQLPIDYDSDADCPLFKKFLQEILNPDQILVIQEWFGYCLYRAHIFKKGLILVGEKDTGKTTLIKILENFLGLENVSGEDLQSFSHDKFSMTNLYEKHANIADELKTSDIMDTGKFKKATGESSLKGEYKFGASFNFTSYAKLTFACNKIPSVREIDDDAYFNRWIVIPFTKNIEKKDLYLKEKIYKERAGIFNYAIAGLKRLLSNETFSYPLTVDEIREVMSRYGSIVARFVYDCLEEAYDDDEAWILKEDMHRHFLQYCKENHERPTGSITVFAKELLYSANYISDSTAKNQYTGNRQQRVWRYVRFKEEVFAPQTPKSDTLDSFQDSSDVAA